MKRWKPSAYQEAASLTSGAFALVRVPLKSNLPTLACEKSPSMVLMVFPCTHHVRRQKVFGGWGNAMMGAGFPIMAWGFGVLQEDWSMWLSGAKLQREQTTWEVV